MSSPSHTEMTEILNTRMYDSSIVPSLEAYLHSQANTLNPEPYYFDANRILVKQYTFFPQLLNAENMALIQLLAMIYGSCDGRVDFGALHCLIPESSKKVEPFISIFRCADLLSGCQFSEFWAAYKELCCHPSIESFPVAHALVNAPGTYLQLRKSILSILSLTYKSASVKDVVLSALNLTNETELMQLLDSVKDIVDSVIDGKFSFHSRAENTKRVKVFQESIDFGVIKGLLTSNGQ